MIGERSSCKSSCDDNRLHAAICHGLTSFRDALQVTCRSSDRPHTKCGQCKACLVDSHIYTTKEWWSQTNDLMRRRFLLALVTHLKSDVIDHLARILKPYVHGKGRFDGVLLIAFRETPSPCRLYLHAKCTESSRSANGTSQESPSRSHQQSREIQSTHPLVQSRGSTLSNFISPQHSPMVRGSLDFHHRLEYLRHSRHGP